MVAQVEAHLEKNPNDGRGWQVVAPVYMRMGRFNDAVRARAQTRPLAWRERRSREADLGEAQVAAANGVVTADAKATFERALKADAGEPEGAVFHRPGRRTGRANGGSCAHLARDAGAGARPMRRFAR